MLEKRSIEVLGIGAPFVDYIVHVPEQFLESIHGRKGGMLPVTFKEFSQILSNSKNEPYLMFGGSATNTVKGLNLLGHQSAIFGKIGQDVIGSKFLEYLSSISLKSYLIPAKTPTAQALCLITPDGERTMRSFLGASVELTELDLSPMQFEKVKLVHIEGYRLFNKTLVLEAMKLAKKAGALVSLDLSSFEVVQAFKEHLVYLIANYVDILFGNEKEIHALTGLGPKKGVRVLSSLCPVVIGLCAHQGSIVAKNENIIEIPAVAASLVDSTGAGDLFAAGFLHGYLENRSLDQCAYFGALTGGAVIETKGVDIPPDRWDLLKIQMK